MAGDVFNAKRSKRESLPRCNAEVKSHPMVAFDFHLLSRQLERLNFDC